MGNGISAYIKINVGNGYTEVSVKDGTGFTISLSDSHKTCTLTEVSRETIKLLHKQLGLLLELE